MPLACYPDFVSSSSTEYRVVQLLEYTYLIGGDLEAQQCRTWSFIQAVTQKFPKLDRVRCTCDRKKADGYDFNQARTRPLSFMVFYVRPPCCSDPLTERKSCMCETITTIITTLNP